jgi:hypothetical protein
MQESHAESIERGMKQRVEVGAVRLFHFLPFLYSSRPWTEERIVVGVLITDGTESRTFVRGTYRAVPSVCHFAQRVEIAAKRRTAATASNAKDLLDLVGREAIDKGTSMGFGNAKSVSASSMEGAMVSISKCYMDGDPWAAGVPDTEGGNSELRSA